MVGSGMTRDNIVLHKNSFLLVRRLAFLYAFFPFRSNYDLSSTQSITGATAYGQNITTATTGTYLTVLLVSLSLAAFANECRHVEMGVGKVSLTS
jgi:hypothetical protein